MEHVIERQMQNNRKLFKIEFLSGATQFSMVTGAFLAGFISLLGGSDSLNGTIGAIPSMLGFLQVFSALYFEKLDFRKKPMVKLVTVLRILFGISYLIPLLFIGTPIALPLFVVLYIISFAVNAFAMPAVNDLLINSTPVGIRGRYLVERERIGMAVVMVITFVMGQILDVFETGGYEATGFVVLALIILVLGGVNTYSVKHMDEITHNQGSTQLSFKEAVIIPLKDKGFRKVVVLFILWNIGFFIGAPFIAVYHVTTLEVSYTYMMLLGLVGTVLRIIVAKFWGELADRKSWFLSLEASLFFIALSHFGYGFVTKTNFMILSPIMSIIAGFAWGGLGVSLFNIQYKYASKKGRTMYIGMNAAIGGIASLVAVRISGTFIEHMKGSMISVFSFPHHPMQIVFYASGIIIMTCVFYVRFVLRKEPAKE